jgi:hypothetical protein
MRDKIFSDTMTKGETYYVGSSDGSPFIYRGHVIGGFKAEYSSSSHTMRPRVYVYQETTTEQQPKENTMTKLYEMTIDGKQKFGNKLAVNSSGDWVMEIKGEGTVMSVPKSVITEVVPYTVSVKFCGRGETQQYSYFATKGDWEVGDFVIVDSATSSLAAVATVNSKSPAATKWLTGLKLQGTYIKSGE